MNSVSRSALKAVVEGVLWSLLVILLLWLTLPTGVWSHNLYPAYSRRFDGGCNGWTRSMALLDMGQNVGLWIVYCTMSVVLARLHPLPRRDVPRAAMTLGFMVAFIVGCGFKHLVDAYTTLYPNYPFSIVVGYLLVIVSTSALWFIAVSLQTAKTKTTLQRQELARFTNTTPETGR